MLTTSYSQISTGYPAQRVPSIQSFIQRREEEFLTFSLRPLGQTLLELLVPFATSFDSLREMSFGDFHLNNMSQFSGCRFRFEPTLSSSLPSFGRESPVGGVSLVRERGRIGRDGFGEEVAGCDLNRIFWPIILAYDSLGGRHHALVSRSRLQGCFQTP